MTQDMAIMERIVAREKASREAAEHLLEVKSLKLYEKNKELSIAAQKLVQSNAVLSEIMASVPDGIVTCREDFTIRTANKAAALLFDAGEDDIRKYSLERLLPNIATVLNPELNGTFILEKYIGLTLKGESIPLEIRGTKGTISQQSGYVFVLHNITNRLKNQKQREQMAKQMDESQRLEAIGALSTGIAHEINTPIQFIGDNLDYLKDAVAKLAESNIRFEAMATKATMANKEEIKLDAAENIDTAALSIEIDSALEDSVDGIKQVRDIILLMKDFAHPGSGEKDFVDLNELVENVLKFCRSRLQKITEVKLLLDQELPLVQCRHGQVQQVILNIVMNAIDAVEDTPEGKRSIQIKTCRLEENVQLSISDTGGGIPESLKKKIFHPFFTTKPVGKGTGQGLALAKDCIIKGHGGKLSLGDEDGFSTTFLIELPIQNENVAQKNQEIQDVG